MSYMCKNCGLEMETLKKKCPNCNEENHIKRISVKESNNSGNTIAKILKIVGWLIIICGFIIGIVLGNTLYEYGNYEFNTGAMLITWGASVISMLVIFALAEIIQILHDIKLKVYSK